jgi:hypothetical protein
MDDPMIWGAIFPSQAYPYLKQHLRHRQSEANQAAKTREVTNLK